MHDALSSNRLHRVLDTSITVQTAVIHSLGESRPRLMIHPKTFKTLYMEFQESKLAIKPDYGTEDITLDNENETCSIEMLDCELDPVTITYNGEIMTITCDGSNYVGVEMRELEEFKYFYKKLKKSHEKNF